MSLRQNEKKPPIEFELESISRPTPSNSFSEPDQVEESERSLESPPTKVRIVDHPTPTGASSEPDRILRRLTDTVSSMEPRELNCPSQRDATSEPIQGMGSRAGEVPIVELDYFNSLPSSDVSVDYEYEDQLAQNRDLLSDWVTGLWALSTRSTGRFSLIFTAIRSHCNDIWNCYRQFFRTIKQCHDELPTNVRFALWNSILIPIVAIILGLVLFIPSIKDMEHKTVFFKSANKTFGYVVDSNRSNETKRDCLQKCSSSKWCVSGSHDEGMRTCTLLNSVPFVEDIQPKIMEHSTMFVKYSKMFPGYGFDQCFYFLSGPCNLTDAIKCCTTKNKLYHPALISNSYSTVSLAKAIVNNRTEQEESRGEIGKIYMFYLDGRVIHDGQVERVSNESLRKAYPNAPDLTAYYIKGPRKTSKIWAKPLKEVTRILCQSDPFNYFGHSKAIKAIFNVDHF